jgi:hypothetical protein
MPEPTPKPYLDYLEKEMTIMGVLSAFCLGVLSFSLGTANRVTAAYGNGPEFVIVGSVLLFAAAWLFYLERSHLAWLYGGIAMAASEPSIGGTVKGWLKEANSWAAWIPYRLAFGCLIVAGMEYGAALLGVLYPSLAPGSFWRPIVVVVPVGFALLLYLPWMLVLTKFRHANDPLVDAFKRYWRRGKVKNG